MDSRRERMLQRRGELLEKIARQRDEIAAVGVRWQPALHVADQALLAARFVRKNVWLVAGIAGVALLRRHGAISLFKGGWRIWKLYRYASDLAGKAASPLK